MALKINSGVIPRAKKVVIYGAEGIGKTTLSSKFPEPLYLDMEDGTAGFDVNRIEKPISFASLIETIKEVANTPNICKTLVIDTADWCEQMCMDNLCAKYKKEGIEAFGYGRGYTYLGEEFSHLLEALNLVVDSGVHVVVTAHAKMRKFEQPDEMGAYDRWEMKLTKNVAPILKEWCDMLLFCNYKTYVVESTTGSKKAQGGKRVMYTSHNPCWDAKNRCGLNDELPMEWDSISHLFKDVPQAVTKSNVPEQKQAKETEEDDFLAIEGYWEKATSLGVNRRAEPKDIREKCIELFKTDLTDLEKEAITFVGKWAAKAITNNI